MKRPGIFIFIVASIFSICAQGQSAARPRITGIDHVAFYTSAPDGVKKLYSDELGLASAEPLEPGGLVRYIIGRQWVGYSAAPDPKAIDHMDHVAFVTENVDAMRAYLAAKGVKAAAIEERSDHSRSFSMKDPEGHRIEFVERAKSAATAVPDSAVSRHVIHAGFLVQSRDAEDHFYRDLLGFRPYWHGGMHEGVSDWVSLQVPDGSDWLEYMLNQEHPDQRVTGIMNHVSFGVADMKQAQAKLESHSWKPHGEEIAKIGRDGKWQLNLYDPDGTRVEVMEFKPVEKPCCSEFTAAHPSE